MTSLTKLTVEVRTTCSQCGDQQDHVFIEQDLGVDHFNLDDYIQIALKEEGWSGGVVCPRCAKGKEESHGS